MEKCIFCDCKLDPGSEEHVFLSALGGRTITRKALCLNCNNSFASKQGEKIDDALADAFKEIRNYLKIWSGRDAPPPTLLQAGQLEDGTEFDLAPGCVPVVRPGRLPKQIETGKEHLFPTRDEDDARRILDIIQKRGLSAQIKNLELVEQKAPAVKISTSFDGPKVWRSIAKTAVVSFVVLYGNEQARNFILKDLRSAIRSGTPDISDFAGCDFVNTWPTLEALTPHIQTPDAISSCFDHSIIIADVQNYSVAYVTLFGFWRFSVKLGQMTGLPSRGLALNPRSTKLARFHVSAQAPSTYVPRNSGSFKSEHGHVMEGVTAAYNAALKKWEEESRADYVKKLTNDLLNMITKAGQSQPERAVAIRDFAEKLMVLEHGAAWRTELGDLLNEDH